MFEKEISNEYFKQFLFVFPKKGELILLKFSSFVSDISATSEFWNGDPVLIKIYLKMEYTRI